MPGSAAGTQIHSPILGAERVGGLAEIAGNLAQGELCSAAYIEIGRQRAGSSAWRRRRTGPQPRPHKILLARRAPSASASNFAQQIDG